MATPKLFRLKAEVAVAPSGPRALVLPCARILVDTGVFHLDQLFDYQIPEKLSASISLGVRVQVPFGNRETEGIVVDRVEAPERAGELKSISKVLSALPVASEHSLELIVRATAHYACNPWDIIRSAMPPRVASVERNFTPTEFTTSTSIKGTLAFETLAPYVAAEKQAARLVHKHVKAGSILVVAPDERDVDRIILALQDMNIEPLKMTAAMPRADRYRNFLAAKVNPRSVVVGTRSAIFLPVNNLSLVIVHKEGAPEHYEVRSPGWNTRTIAMMRSEMDEANCIFTGFTPSLEIAQGIEDRVIKYSNLKETINVKSFSPSDGALLPGRIFSEIRKALKDGPVLFIAPRKGYGNALLCAHCRNLALCDCGGKLSVSVKAAVPCCVHCGKEFQGWKCSYCNRDKQYLAGRGIERAAEELARAFPNYPVVISAGEVIKERVENKPCLVLATPNAEPQVEGGFAAVVILDGMRFFSHIDLRAQERAREIFFQASSLTSAKGSVLLVIDESHPITAAIARWNVAPLIKRELNDRLELQLPPTVFSVAMAMKQSEGVQIANGLRKLVDEGRLPQSCRIYGPTQIQKDQVKIVIHAASSDSQILTDVVHELQRRRSIAKKELFTLRVEPYSL